MIVVPPSADPHAPVATGLEVRPFRALTYQRRDPAHLSRVSSPAYDLVSPEGREQLAAVDPHNIVHLILPRTHLPGDDRATDDDCARLDRVDQSAALAARTLREWQATGVLERDEEPALWLYELAPTDGSPATVGWLGAVVLPPSGSAAVLPHEDTYPVAVEGRRALLAATRTDLEPIVLAHDPEPAVAELTDRARRGPATLQTADADGVRHRLWRLHDTALVSEVTQALSRTQAIIADGHHRFAAARAHHQGSPDLPGSDAVLALVTSSGTGGLRVEAIHRVIAGLPFDQAVASAAAGFTIEHVAVDRSAGTAVVAARSLAQEPAGSLLLSDGRQLVALSRPTSDVRAAVPPEAAEPWRDLDVVLVQHGLFGRLWQLDDDPSVIGIAHDIPTALHMARERGGTAVLLRGPSPDDVAAVARAGARMPRKSTLFVPKPRSGLVLRPLAD
jgi:uncharacterized protein (DUF1015 family)